MHEYTVELRIYGRDLNVTSVTKQLGLEPSLVRNIGDRRSETTQWEEAMWSYDGAPDSPGNVTWSSLEEGLGSIFEKLWPLKDEIDGLKEKYQVILWCGQFLLSSNGSTTLSSHTLKKLGDFGVELFLDSYCSVGSEQEKNADTE